MLCGIDVSSRWLDAALHSTQLGRTGTPTRFANTSEGIARLADFCRAQQVELVAMEATGGYERQAFAHLSGEGLPVAILNPRAVRQFAQSMGRLEKTDAIDAGIIAWFADVKRCQPSTLAPPAQQHLRALVTRLRQLTDLRTLQKNQQRLIENPNVQGSFAELLALLKRQIEALAEAIAGLIADDPLWHELDLAFRTIKGVADRTVARIMAELPEIGTLSNKAVSKLAGLAPLAQDSGLHQGRRAIRGGRAAVRDLLFIVASVAGRYEPDFVAFRERLAGAGKPPKVVRIALAHKLLVRLNAKARDARRRLSTSPQAALA